MDLRVDYAALEAMGDVARDVAAEVRTGAQRAEAAVERLQGAVGQQNVAEEVVALLGAARSTSSEIVTALLSFGAELRQAAADYRAVDVKLAQNATASS